MAEATAPGSASRDYYVLAVALIGVATLWIRPLGSSLWLDETGTFWVIQGGLGDVFQRALDFQGQFPLYHVLLWGWSRLAGTSELALRFPSVVGAGVATWLCYRLALRLFGRIAVARLAACIFVLLPPVAFAAGDARPYAMALATLIAAALALDRWMETRALRDGVAYLALAAVTLYLHYLFGLALVSHAVLAYRRLRRDDGRAALFVAAVAGLLGLLMLPSIPHVLAVVDRREAMSTLASGSIPELLAWVVPPAIVIAFLAGRIAGGKELVQRSGSDEPRGDLLVFLVLWLLVPPVSVFVIGRVSGLAVWGERHFLSAAPALALLAAAAFGLLASRQQRIAIVVLAILTVLTYGRPYHFPSDWRAAAEAANALTSPGTPILVYTGFSESREMDWIRDEERSQLFLAPLVAYPVEGRMFPLPLRLTNQAKVYVQEILDRVIPGTDRIVLITAVRTEAFEVWLAERTSALGFTERDAGEFGTVRVLLFER